MNGQTVIQDYTFSPTEKKVVSSEFNALGIDNIIQITNTKTSEVIYDARREGKGGTLAGDTLTLLYNTIRMSPDDELQIVYYSDRGNVATVSKVADSADSQLIAGANASRKELIIQNDSSSVLYLKFGETATVDDYTVRLEQYEVLITEYVGRVDGIWASNSTGSARVTEIV